MVVFGILCCTFIPNNTAPDGSVFRALKELTYLSKELAENSENSYFTTMLQSWFSRWTSVIVSVVGAVAVTVAILIVCSCCCIACIKNLTGRLTNALTEQQTQFYLR